MPAWTMQASFPKSMHKKYSSLLAKSCHSKRHLQKWNLVVSRESFPGDNWRDQAFLQTEFFLFFGFQIGAPPFFFLSFQVIVCCNCPAVILLLFFPDRHILFSKPSLVRFFMKKCSLTVEALSSGKKVHILIWVDWGYSWDHGHIPCYLPIPRVPFCLLVLYSFLSNALWCNNDFCYVLRGFTPQLSIHKLGCKAWLAYLRVSPVYFT